MNTSNVERILGVVEAVLNPAGPYYQLGALGVAGVTRLVSFIRRARDLDNTGTVLTDEEINREFETQILPAVRAIKAANEQFLTEEAAFRERLLRRLN